MIMQATGQSVHNTNGRIQTKQQFDFDEKEKKRTKNEQAIFQSTNGETKLQQSKWEQQNSPTKPCILCARLSPRKVISMSATLLNTVVLSEAFNDVIASASDSNKDSAVVGAKEAEDEGFELSWLA
jgi:hypothetical protein